MLHKNHQIAEKSETIWPHKSMVNVLHLSMVSLKSINLIFSSDQLYQHVIAVPTSCHTMSPTSYNLVYKHSHHTAATANVSYSSLPAPLSDIFLATANITLLYCTTWNHALSSYLYVPQSICTVDIPMKNLLKTNNILLTDRHLPQLVGTDMVTKANSTIRPILWGLKLI